MHFLFYHSISGAANYAAAKLGHTVSCIKDNASSLEEVSFGHVVTPLTIEQHPDVLVTSAFALEGVRKLVKELSPQWVIWDLGPKPPIKSQVNMALIPLQLSGYITVLLKGLSSHVLGYNYISNRDIVIAKKKVEPTVNPAKLSLKKPFQPLSSIINTSEDIDIIPFRNGSMLFHKEPRPWSFVSQPRGDSHLQSHPLSVKVGAVWYNINGKLHRLTVSEAATIVGYPIEAQKQLQSITDDNGLAIYTILRDLPMPVWVDVFERCIL